MARRFRDSLASMVSIGSFRVHAMHNHDVVMNPGKITDHWTLSKEIVGKGAAGSVCKATCNNRKTLHRAVKKCYKVRERDSKALHREVNIMKLMDHPNVIRLYEVFEDRRCLYFVLEMCSGGELMEHIVNRQSLSEKDSARVIRQVLRGVAYMHEKHVAHRDLKPENFLLQDSKPLLRCTLKIIDFGCAAQVVPGTYLKTRAGTPAYIAPEMLIGDNRHNLSCDNWSIGVVTFFLLSGDLPFNATDQEAIFAQVRKGDYSFTAAVWQNVSQDAKDLVSRLLLKEWEVKKLTDVQKDITKRVTAADAMKCEWVKRLAPGSMKAEDPALLEHLRAFQDSNRLKKAALHGVARQVDSNKIQQLQETFFSLDSNGDGHLTLLELEKALQTIGAGLSDEQVASLASHVDTDQDGEIAYTEFIAAAIDLKEVAQEDALWSAFCTFDVNGDGKISEEELEKVLMDEDVQQVLSSGGLNRGSIKGLLAEADISKDGYIDFEEFLALATGAEPARLSEKWVVSGSQSTTVQGNSSTMGTETSAPRKLHSGCSTEDSDSSVVERLIS